MTWSSLITSRTPLTSQVRRVARTFSSGVLTLPVSRTAASFTVTSTTVFRLASSWMNLSWILVKITLSETDVDSPFSVEDAATAAVPTPTMAGAHPVRSNPPTARSTTDSDSFDKKGRAGEGVLMAGDMRWRSMSVVYPVANVPPAESPVKPGFPEDGHGLRSGAAHQALRRCLNRQIMPPKDGEIWIRSKRSSNSGEIRRCWQNWRAAPAIRRR